MYRRATRLCRSWCRRHNRLVSSTALSPSYSFSFPGPFLQDPSCLRFVDFTATIYMDYHSIIVPLIFSPQPLSFLYPLNPYVWMATLISIPVYMLAMGFCDMYFYRSFRIKWSPIVEFVLRTAMNEHSAADKMKLRVMFYKRVLMMTWIFVFFIITQSYAGLLTGNIYIPFLISFTVPFWLGFQKVSNRGTKYL